MTLMEAIRAYTEKFDAGPPVFGLDEEAAIAAIRQALDTGEPIEQGADENIPDDAAL